MTLRQGAEEYYQKFIELQEKLRSSEEERLKLEMKFNEMVQVTRDEEQMYYRRLRSQYKHFMEENSRRQERNDRILRLMERIESRAAILEAKTRRIQLLRTQYRAILERISKGVECDKPKIQTKDDYKEDILKKYLEMQKQIQSSQIADQIMQSIQSRKSTKGFVPESSNNRSKLGFPDLSKFKDYNTTKSMNNNRFDDLLDACSDLKNIPKENENAPASNQNFENREKQNWLPKIPPTTEAENLQDTSNGYQIENSACDLLITDKKVKDNTKIAEEINQNVSNPVSKIQDELIEGVSDVVSDKINEIQPKEIEKLQENIQATEQNLQILKEDKIITEVVDETSKNEFTPTEIIDEDDRLKTLENSEILNDQQINEPDVIEEKIFEQQNIDSASRFKNDEYEELHDNIDKIEENQERNEENNMKEQMNLDGDIIDNKFELELDAKEDQKETNNDGNIETTIVKDVAIESSSKNDSVETKEKNEAILNENIISEQVNIATKQDIEEIEDQNFKVVSEDVKEVLMKDEVVEDQVAPIEQTDLVQSNENNHAFDRSGDQYQNDDNQLEYDESIKDLNEKMDSHDVKEVFNEDVDQVQSDLLQPDVLYDENGQAYDASGNQYQYDNNQGYDGNYDASQVQYDENGQPMVYDESAYYDENGQPIYYDENGQPIQYDGTMQYDENGQPLQQEYGYENGGDQQEFPEGPESSEIQNVGDEAKGADLDENEKKRVNVIDLLETDSESSKQETKASNGSDFDFSNA